MRRKRFRDNPIQAMRVERQARDKAVSDAKKIQKTAPEHRWGGRTIFAKGL
jgi:hypothetical protein